MDCTPLPRPASIRRAANIRRREWRDKCRQALSDHLSMLDSDLWTVPQLTKLQGRRLGINVHPADVRLQPGVEDGYEWKPLPGVEDGYEWKPLPGMENLYNEGLFTKQLSKHSLGAYMELYRGLGVSFQAAVMVLCKLCASANVPASPAAATGQKLPSPRGSMPCSWKTQDLLMSSTLGRHRLKYILKREKAQREE